MLKKYVAATPFLVVGPFNSESDASDYIATRSSGADYRILELAAPKGMGYSPRVTLRGDVIERGTATR